MFHISESRNDIYQNSGAYTRLPPLKPPAAKFASQGDAHVRTEAKFKFRYYPPSKSQEQDFSQRICAGIQQMKIFNKE